MNGQVAIVLQRWSLLRIGQVAIGNREVKGAWSEQVCNTIESSY